MLAQWTQPPSPDNRRETAIKIFSHLLSSNVVPENFYDSLASVFLQGLKDKSSIEIRLASLEASIRFLTMYKQFKPDFQKCIPDAFEVSFCLLFFHFLHFLKQILIALFT